MTHPIIFLQGLLNVNTALSKFEISMIHKHPPQLYFCPAQLPLAGKLKMLFSKINDAGPVSLKALRYPFISSDQRKLVFLSRGLTCERRLKFLKWGFTCIRALLATGSKSRSATGLHSRRKPPISFEFYFSSPVAHMWSNLPGRLGRGCDCICSAERLLIIFLVARQPVKPVEQLCLRSH